MDGLDLPPSLIDVLDGLHRETTGLAIASSLRRLLQQAQSPLSLVRRDAYGSLATSLDAYLSDPARAAAVLPALGRVWPELLQSIAMGLRQAPSTRSTTASPRGQPSGSSPLQAAGVAGGGTSYRAVTTAELSSMVLVLELACLLALQARQSSLEAGLLPLLLAQLPAAPPDLACACLDACLAIQLRSPAAFVSFSGQQGVQQVCRLMRDGATPEPVRAHAVQFLNLLLTQLVPDLLPPDALPPPSPSPATPGASAPTPRARLRPAPTEGQPEQQAAVIAGLAGAKEAVAEILGREARAMLLRRVSLADGTAEQKLGQLSNALTLFIESDA
ncbi:hypothetical protein D9Q98_004634 [Chlorella vulgaris]|uniref:Uncharacterized protein n=1 Tax=Chlorella vulgaris TaxID=3077 RepID=A0A9D4YY43_CHLVU|nr:hypothetical protein D9Q98_004634 [Chlorella vulgaris]